MERESIFIEGNLPLFNSQKEVKSLTVNLKEGKIDKEGFYKGKIDSNLVIKGTIIKPKIGGEISLNNGKAKQYFNTSYCYW